jgi:hypothetical protein
MGVRLARVRAIALLDRQMLAEEAGHEWGDGVSCTLAGDQCLGGRRHVPRQLRRGLEIPIGFGNVGLAEIRGQRDYLSGERLSARRASLQARVAKVCRLFRTRNKRHTFLFALSDAWRVGEGDQELAGHQDLATTQRYMHVSPGAVEATIGLLDQTRADF